MFHVPVGTYSYTDLGLCLSLILNNCLIDHVSHPYTTGNITVLYIFMCVFLYSWMEDKTFCTEWQQAFPDFNLLFIAAWIEFWFSIISRGLNCVCLLCDFVVQSGHDTWFLPLTKSMSNLNIISRLRHISLTFIPRTLEKIPTMYQVAEVQQFPQKSTCMYECRWLWRTPATRADGRHVTLLL
jgi:hypothetical protein